MPVELSAPAQTPGELPELLTAAIIRQRVLPVGERTFWRWVSCGTFPKPDVSIGGKVRLWKRETVQQWKAECAKEKQ